ncbi:hypothetical protein ANTRET_LOCUS11132 [Anthophora retusa]
MLDSLVRVSRRVLRVPKAIASPTGNSNFGQSKDTACQQLNRPGDGTRSVPPEHKSRHARGKRRRTPNKIARTQRSPAASSNLTARLTRARLGTFFKNVGGDIRETNEEMERQGDTRRKQYMGYVNDPQPSVVQELYPWTAMCVRNVDVHVSCSSHVDAQLAAFFIDPRAK